MSRLIWIFILWALLLAAFVEAGVYHFFGWKGVVAFPIILVTLGLMARYLGPKLFLWLLMIPFRAKGSVLRKADVQIHSLKPVTVLRRMDEVEAEAGESKEDLWHYYEADVTITPREKKPGGFQLWEPAEFILVDKPRVPFQNLEDESVGHVHDVHVWRDGEFGPDDPGKYLGPQRLKLTFAVKPGTTKAWMHYYAEQIGALEFPPPQT